MGFDYSNTETDDEAVRTVAAEISGGGLQPLSAEEQIAREYWRERQRQRDQQMRLERERRAAEAAAEARRQAAVVRQQERDRRVREMTERIELQNRQRKTAELEHRVAQTQNWQRNVEQARANAVRQQYQKSLLDDLKNLVNPPAEPEPEVIYVEPYEGSDQLGDRDFNVELWRKKPRPWW